MSGSLVTIKFILLTLFLFVMQNAKEILAIDVSYDHKSHVDRLHHKLNIRPSFEVPSWVSLPLIPKILPETATEMFYYNATTPLQPGAVIDSNGLVKKHIPRILWVAVKSRNDSLPDHFQAMVKKNPDWIVNVCDNQCKDEFMSTVFANTSIEALYNLINPIAYASKADIWRYCVLYTYGGFYLDDDSLIGTSFSEIVLPADELILSEEGPSSLGDCYIPSYHLHDENTHKRFQHNQSQAAFFNGVDPSTGFAKFFHGNTILNWGIFSSPRHPIIQHTLQNIYEILYFEYIRHPVLHITKWDQRWKYVLCGTTFVLTYALREMALLNDPEVMKHNPRICHRDFNQYYGKAKAIWTGKIPGHYMKAMNKDKNINILRHHAPLDVKSVISYLEGSAITGETKDVYLVKNGIRRPFGSYSNFLAMNFTDARIRHVREPVLLAMPLGPPLGEDGPIQPAILPVEDVVKNPVTISSSSSSSAAAAAAVISNQGDVVGILTKARDDIDKTNYQCFGDDYAGTRDDALRDAWKGYVGKDMSVMAYPMCLRTFQLGNTIGYFLNDLACSDLSGSHFIGISKHFDITGADPKNRAATSSNGNANHLSFFNALPDLIVHSHPLPPSQSKDIMKRECQCLQYCWENSQAPWLKRIPYISSYLRTAIESYVKNVSLTISPNAKSVLGDAIPFASIIKTELNNETDSIYMSKAIKDLHQADDGLVPSSSLHLIDLPLLPDVTIQYRCGDNIGFGKTRYGLLPFRAYKTRIPANSKLIYIIADSPTRSIYHAYSGRCSIILGHLGTYIQRSFPSSTVVIKRGGDLLLDYARLTYSPVTICSASTFCLWPALANQNTVHFPLTPLVARADTNDTAPDLGLKSFHWITDVLLIKEFKSYRPWTRLIDALEE